MMGGRNMPIVMGSAPSSGSTLLVNLIGRIPGIYQTDELSIFDKPDWLDLSPSQLARRWDGMRSRGYRRRLACEMRPAFTGATVFPRPKAGEDYFQFACRYMDDAASGQNCRRWVEKTPGNIFSFLELLKRNTHAKFVVIVRDARPVMMSLLKRGYSPVIAVARWYLSNLQTFRILHDARALVLKYEELVTDPETTCRRLFAFIEEEPDAGVLRGGASGKTLESWSASPAEPIQTVGLWSEDKTLEPTLAPIFERMRATPHIGSAWGDGSLPSPLELQSILGYGLDGLSATSETHPAGADLRYRMEIWRYRGSMLRHALLPKPIPFQLVDSP